MRRSVESPLCFPERDLQVASTGDGKRWGDFNWDVERRENPSVAIEDYQALFGRF